MNKPGCNLVVSDRSYLIIHRFRIFELCPKGEDLDSVNSMLFTALSAPWTTLVMKYDVVLDLINVDEWEPPCHAVL